jgi:hypothetical protein
MPSIDKFIDWTKAGRRSVEVSITTISAQDAPIKVWCYDYDLSFGKHVGIDDDPPTEEAMRAQEKAALLDRLAEIDKPVIPE